MEVLPIEIRPGVFVRIACIPWDLTPAEAAKVSAVVLAFATPAAVLDPEDTARYGSGTPK